jgi:hypothetical protein
MQLQGLLCLGHLGNDAWLMAAESAEGLGMKRTRSDVARLAAELRLDSSSIDAAYDMNSRAVERIRHGANDSLDHAALGYTIHNLYGIMENACFRISKFFENGLSPDAWHKELLNRMLLDIPKTRPAFLSPDGFALIDELRSFRHVFRNLYGRELDSDRLAALQAKVPASVEAFKASVDRYVDFLDRLGDSIEE